MLNCGSVARPEAPPSKAEGLLEAWESFGLDGPGPTRDDFTPFNLKPWLGYIDIYQVERSGCAAAPEFRLRLNGSKVVALTGEEWTGHTAREIDRVLGGHLQGDLLEVFRSEAPSSNPVRLYRKTYIVAHRRRSTLTAEAAGWSRSSSPCSTPTPPEPHPLTAPRRPARP